MNDRNAELHVTPQDVVAFWREAGPTRWFQKDEAFDRLFRERFLAAHEAAAAGALAGWQDSADGMLALLILLDQFPRNAFRGSPRMFATDAQALDLAHRAIAAGLDLDVEESLRAFMYLPLEHAESLPEQERAVELTRSLDADTHRWAVVHRDIIASFGRFPHRNALLGRSTTPEEQRFLDDGGFAG